jgi:hypothetical protein
MQQLFTYNHNKFDNEGINQATSEFFLEIIKDWEKEFNQEHTPLKATHLFANIDTMTLIGKCLDLDKSTKAGMDIIDDKIDIETNTKIEEHSEFATIYAIGSGIKENEGEPLYLVADSSISENQVILKHISNDEKDEVPTDIPVNLQKAK